MAVDRGGLQYGINVDGNFARGLGDFVEGVRSARTEWRGLRNDLQKPIKVKATDAGNDSAQEAADKRAAAKAKREEAQAKRASEKAAKARQKLNELVERENNKIGNKQLRIAETQSAAEDNARSRTEKKRLASLQRQLSDNEAFAKRLDRVFEKVNQNIIKADDATKKKLLAQDQRLFNARIKLANQIEAEQNKIGARQAREADAAIATRIRSGDSLLKQRTKQEDATEKARLNFVEKKAAVERALQNQRRVQEEADERARDAAVNKRSKVENSLFRQRTRLENEQRRAADRAFDAAIREQNKAGKELARRQRAELVAAERIEKVKQRAIDKRATRDARELEKALRGSDDAASRLFFTFRRLFGVLAVFQAARVLVQKFREAVGEVFRFNSRIEDAVLGVQSLLTAVGSLSTVQGRTLEGAEKFAAANAEARRQVQLLRLEGLKTAATFDQLLEAFQTALAPGIRAGLSPDQIRGFAVRIAQAAASISLPQNQLAEEIRSILTGTIQARTTRIAVALGITNDDIRRAREAGKLADFLLQRFDAFKFSGEAALGNFTTLVSNVKDAVSQVIGTGGKDLFDFVVSGLKSVLNVLVQTTDQGVILNPKIVELARQFFGILLQAARVSRDIFGFLTLDAAVQAMTNFATIMRGVVVVAGGFIKGFVDGLRLSAEYAKAIGKGINVALKAFGFTDALPIEDLAAFLGILGSILAVAISVRAVFKTLSLPITLLVGTLRPVSRILTTIVAGMFKLLGLTKLASGSAFLLSAPFLALAAVIGVIVAAFQNDFIRSIDIGGLKIGTIVDLIKVDMGLAVDGLGNAFELAWEKFSNAANVALSKAKNFLKIKALEANLVALEARDALFGNAQTLIVQAAAELAALREESKNNIDEIELASKRKLLAIEEEYEAEKRAAARRKAELKELDKVGPRRSLTEAFDEVLNGLKERLNLEKDIKTETVDATTEAGNLVDEFAKLQPILDAVVDALDKQGEVLKGIRETTADLNDELQASIRAAGVEGFAAKIAEAFGKTTSEIRNATRELALQGNIARESLQGLDAQQATLSGRILASSNITKLALTNIVNAGIRLADIETKRAAHTKAINTLLEEQKLAVEAGNKSREKAATDSLKGLEEETSLLSFLIENQKEAVRSLIKLSGLNDAETKKLTKDILELASVEGRRISLKKTLIDLTTAQGELESSLLDKFSKQNQKLAIEEEARLKQINRRVQAELEGARFVDDAKRRTQGIAGPLPGVQNESVRAIAQARADLVLARQRTEEFQQQFALQKQILEQAIKSERNDQTRLALQKALNETSTEFAQNIEKSGVEVQNIIEEMKRLRFIIEEPVEAGFSAALEDFAANARDTFTVWQNIGRTAVEGFADFASETISEALDPTKAQNVVERFRVLMQQIVDEVIKAFIRLQIVKSILEPLGLVGGTSQSEIAAASAAAATAVVAATSAAASAALAQAALASVVAVQAQNAVGTLGGLGLASGGPVPSVSTPLSRPANVPSSDTTPLWGTPGEFMHRVAAVRDYGLDVMHAINERRINPDLLRSLIGVSGAAKSRRRASGAGYALGGEIRSSASLRGEGSAPVIKIVNIFDKSEILSEVAGRNGEKVVLNLIRSNNGKLQGAR